MKIKLSICLIILCSLINKDIAAQVWNYIPQINSQIASIPCIFAGQVTSVEVFAGDDFGNKLPYSSAQWNGDLAYFYDQSGNEAKGYALAKIRICKIYKDEKRYLEGGQEFEILTKSFTLDNVYLMRVGQGNDADTIVQFLEVPPSHDDGQYPIQLPHPNYPKKLYFCDRFEPIIPSAFANVPYHSNMHSILEMPFNQPVYIPLPDGSYKYTKAHCALVPYAFEDQNQLQLFLNQIQGINPNPVDFCRDKEKLSSIIEPELKIDNTELITNYKKVQELIDAKNAVQVSVMQKSSLAVTATLDMMNERIENIGGQNWFVFDIYSSSNNSSKYFDYFGMNVSYNTSVFGTNVVSGNNFQIIKAAAYNTVNYITSASDISTSVVGFAVSPNTNPMISTRVLLTAIPSIFCTVKIRIQTCNQSVNLSFTNQTSMGGVCSFANTTNENPALTPFYNAVTYNGNITDNACQPIITNYTTGEPDGRHKVITITGKYFGNGKKNGAAVIFRNADKGNRYPVLTGVNGGGIQAIDLISWSDNQIKTVLAGCIDSAYYLNAGNPIPVMDEEIHIGSGKFKVINCVGGSAESSLPIYIPHGVQTYPFTYIDANNQLKYKKVYAKLVNMSQGGYRILVNNRINNAWGVNPTAKSLLKKGMRDWTCATEINWFVGGDTTLKYQSDAWCVVDTANISALMQTIPNVRTCLDNNEQKHWLRSFDIKIKQNPTFSWQLDTSGAITNGNYDFYSAISHELGHGHQVNHINDSIIDLMWWQGLPFGYPTFLSRKVVKGSYEARAAGNFVTDSCKANYNGQGCMAVHTTTYFGNCGEGFDVKVKVYGLNAFNVEVYPNPSRANENIKIQCYLIKPSEIHFTLFDITGKQVLYEHLNNVNSLEHELKTSELNRGIYLLQVDIDRTRQSFKIIKE
jgi:hypothetical protein